MNALRRLSPLYDEATPVLALEPMKTTQGQRPSLNQMERIREIHRLIRRFTDNPERVLHRVTDQSLAEKLEVSDRQIRRDRSVLERLIGERDDQRGNGGLPSALHFDKKRLSWRYTREVDLSVWVGRLDDDELGSLLVAQQALAVFSGMPLARHITHIFEEDASGLVGNQRSALREEITQLVSFHPEGAGRIDPDTFAALFRALLLQQQVEVRYQSKQKSAASTRTLHPYHLCCYKHQWRLIALDGQSGSIRSFVVTPRRLKSVKLLNRTFKRPKPFHPHDHLSRTDVPGHTITLRIGRDGAHHILERNWPGLRATREVEDGALEATFDIADLGEFKRFVLAFGSDCEVLSPAAFRDDIRDEARRMLGAEHR